MIISKINCKETFQEAYEKRYTWPKTFNGYRGKCLYIDNEKSLEGQFTLGKNFKPEIKNILDVNIVKSISSQLFEVCIHRVKRDFNEIHGKNNFIFLNQTNNGIEMRVSGKNDGDRYQVKDKKINMVFRQIHGTIIRIFVQEFLDTGGGFLSKKYTSQQLDIENLSPISKLLEYQDNFANIANTDLWLLESRIIKFSGQDNKTMFNKYLFKELSVI